MEPDDELEVAVAGDGVSPESVPVRETIAVLEAAVALVEAVAREQNVSTPELSLIEVRNHSAGYALCNPNKTGRQVIRRTLDACKKRGEGWGPEVRRSIRRLYAAAKTGHVRISARLNKKPTVVNLAAPIGDAASHVEVCDDIYGHIVGVQLVRGEYRVTIRYSDGGSGTFNANADLALLAAPLFDKNVRARVTFLRGGLDQEGQIEAITQFDEKDFLDVVRTARRRLEERGVSFGTELLDELREDE